MKNYPILNLIQKQAENERINIEQTPQDYFETVYRDTFNKLSRYVMFKTAGIDEAEDIVASVYMNFYQYAALRGKRPGNVMAYLTKMAKHELARLNIKNPRLLSLDDGELNLSESVPDDTDTELDFFDRHDKEDLWQAVLKLSQAEQKIIIAKFRFDMTFSEIARETKQGESAVKLRYYRSIKKLQKYVK